MQSALRITFRGMEPSDAVRNAVEEKVHRLEKVCDCITSCRVVIESPHRHHHKGKLFHVRVDMTVPGREIVVDRHPRERRTHEDVYVAVRDAFDAARDRLEDYVRRRRRNVKTHEPPSQGRVLRLLPEKNCGFIETPGGYEIYFHRNSVLGGEYDKLEPGSEVRFFEEPGEKGPQASTVTPLGRRRSAS